MFFPFFFYTFLSWYLNGDFRAKIKKLSAYDKACCFFKAKD